MSFHGDPRLILTEDGGTLQFVGGQPLLDKGFENMVLIALFTNPGWAGNGLLKSPIGSDFQASINQPITLQALNDIRDAAERALDYNAFGTVTVVVTNPEAHRLSIVIAIEPPGETPMALQLTRNGENWYYQAVDPAYLRVKNGA